MYCAWLPKSLGALPEAVAALCLVSEPTFCGFAGPEGMPLIVSDVWLAGEAVSICH